MNISLSFFFLEDSSGDSVIGTRTSSGTAKKNGDFECNSSPP